MLRHVTCKSGPVPELARYLSERGIPTPASGLTTGPAQRLTKLKSARRDELVSRYEAAADLAMNAAAEIDSVEVVPVRFISACLVVGHWMDHSSPQHLKDALPLFDALPIYTQHVAEPNLWIGSVVDAEWDDTKLGLERAPGISGLVGIERGVSERARVVAAGVKRRSIKRWSLGFLADYDVSHPAEMVEWDMADYWRKLGTVSPVDGEVYRFVVNSIPDVYEFSAVDVGAIDGARTTDAPNSTTLTAKAPASRTFQAPRIPRITPITRPTRGQE